MSEVESTDRKILALLAEDGRMSLTDLGKATGLSTSAVHQRVKREGVVWTRRKREVQRRGIHDRTAS